MKNIAAFRNVTANAKIALVNNKLGNPALKNNQGTSSEVYDYVKVTPGSAGVIRFFEQANTKTFPLTNLTAGGNALQAGEALSVEHIGFSRLVIKAGVLTSFSALTATVAELSLCGFQLLLDNSRLIKANSLVRSFADFNNKGGTAANSLFYPDTDLVIPPQIQFTAELNVPANTDTATEGEEVYYGCHIFGTGAILNLKTNV